MVTSRLFSTGSWTTFNRRPERFDCESVVLALEDASVLLATGSVILDTETGVVKGLMVPSVVISTAVLFSALIALTVVPSEPPSVLLGAASVLPIVVLASLPPAVVLASVPTAVVPASVPPTVVLGSALPAVVLASAPPTVVLVSTLPIVVLGSTLPTVVLPSAVPIVVLASVLPTFVIVSALLTVVLASDVLATAIVASVLLAGELAPVVLTGALDVVLSVVLSSVVIVSPKLALAEMVTVLKRLSSDVMALERSLAEKIDTLFGLTSKFDSVGIVDGIV